MWRSEDSFLLQCSPIMWALGNQSQVVRLHDMALYWPEKLPPLPSTPLPSTPLLSFPVPSPHLASTHQYSKVIFTWICLFAIYIWLVLFCFWDKLRCLLMFGIRSFCVAQPVLKLVILLPQGPWYIDDKFVPLCPTFVKFSYYMKLNFCFLERIQKRPSSCSEIILMPKIVNLLSLANARETQGFGFFFFSTWNIFSGIFTNENN